MPIFTYSCPFCGKKFEKLVKQRDDPPFCPDCGKPTIQVWSTPSPAQWRCPRSTL